MKKIILVFSFFLTLLLNAQIPEEVEFDGLLGEKCSLFGTAKRESVLERKAGNFLAMLYVWTSDKKTDARYPAYKNSPRLKFLSQYPSESILRFNAEGLLESVYFSFYNRGDDSSISEEKFNLLLAAVDTAIAARTGAKPDSRREALGQKNYINRKYYVADGFIYVLRSSFKEIKREFHGEYIQLDILRFDSKEDPRSMDVSRSGQDVKMKRSLIENVVKEADGTVFIDNIPMVDQGDKGYCAVAVAERCLRYFGNTQVNQHMIAQMAGTTAEQGTSTEAMVLTFKRIGVKTGVRAKEKYERFKDIKSLEKFLKKYNSIARKKDLEKVNTVKRGNTVYVGDTISMMDGAVLRETCVADKSEFKNFLSVIKSSVDKGLPVIWCVQLGMIPEKGLTSQTGGGHMRLITGYNDKEKSVIYSDTWGAGHEKKIMSSEDAWVMTSVLLQLEPRR